MRSSICGIILTILFFTCTTNPALSGDGGATETVNAQVTVTDTLVSIRISSDSIINTNVMLFDINYNPAYNTGFKDSLLIRSKDTTVQYSSKTGSYNLIIHQSDSRNSLAFCNIKLFKGADQHLKDTLAPDGSIQGKIISTSFSDADSVYYKLYIPGTPFFTDVHNDTFQLSGIPEGIYYMEISMGIANVKSDSPYYKTLGRNVEVKSSDTTSGIDLFVSK